MRLYSVHNALAAFQVGKRLLNKKDSKGWLAKPDRDLMKDALSYVEGFLKQEASHSLIQPPSLWRAA